MRERARRRENKGLTLLELLIAIAIYALVALSIGLIFSRALAAYRAASDKHRAAVVAQTAAEWIVRDIQAAEEILDARSWRIELQIPGSPVIRYWRSSTQELYRRREGVATDLLARGVRRFRLWYFDENNHLLSPTPLSATHLAQVRIIAIEIRVRERDQDFWLYTVARFAP